MSTEALRFAATLKEAEAPSRPLGEEASVDGLRSKGATGAGIRDVASWLLRVVRACDTVVANKRINAVTRISQARLLAVAIHLRDDLKPSQLQTLLARWEKVSFRIYGMLGHDARTRVGEYVRLAWQVVNEEPPPSAIDAAVGEIGDEFPIVDAANARRNANCYDGWESELRYFMYRYEEYLAQTQKQNFRNEQWEVVVSGTGRAALAAGFDGLRVPSKPDPGGVNLVIFRKSSRGPVITLVNADALEVLGKD